MHKNNRINLCQFDKQYKKSCQHIMRPFSLCSCFYMLLIFKMYNSYFNSTAFVLQKVLGYVGLCQVLLTVGYVDIALCRDLSTWHLDG